MEIGIILVGLVAAFLVFKFVKGMIKFAVLAVLVLGALYVAGAFS